MADNGEHRMVFDVRGRRKNVVKVVYAILAVLMGASLFLTVGPLSISDLFNGGSGSSIDSVLTDQADDLDAKLVKDPDNENLKLQIVRARYAAGNSAVSVDPSTGQTAITQDAIDQYEEAGGAWKSYLDQSPPEPNSQVAQLASNAFFTLAQSATSGTEATSKLVDAAEAQAIVAKARPNVSTVGTLAYYSYFAGNFKVGDKAAKQALAIAPKAQQKTTKKQLDQYRTAAKQFIKQQAALEKAQNQKPGEQLQNPLGGLSGGGAGDTSTTPASP